jgi:hypothetical protein
MKSGTTSLHRYLITHPEVFMTVDPKEPSFFLGLEQLRDVLPGLEKRGLWREEAYLELFREAEGHPIIGEASANYARLPRVTGVAERIAAFAPNSRILFIARDPVERTISHYWYMVRFFEERREIMTALREERDFTYTSDYAMQLEPWLELFPDRVKFITTEALRDQAEITMAGIFEWLDVDDRFVPTNLQERSKETPPTVNQVRGSGLLHRFRYSALWNIVGPRIPPAVRMLARRLSEKQVGRSNVDLIEVRQYLRELHSPQVEALSRLLGRSFPEWTLLHKGT